MLLWQQLAAGPKTTAMPPPTRAQVEAARAAALAAPMFTPGTFGHSIEVFVTQTLAGYIGGIGVVTLPLLCVVVCAFGKDILRWISGKTTLKSIVGSRRPKGSKDKADMAVAFDVYLLENPKFKAICERIHGSSQFILMETMKDILKIEPIDFETCPVAEANITTCLALLKRTNAIISDAKSLMETKYDRDNADHEALLEELWSLLRPEVTRKGGRYTEEWGEIGFQGKDPATDFRGGGKLSLEQMVYFCKNHPEAARKLWADTQKPDAKYFGFAITGINMTGMAADLLKKRTLNRYFYARGCELKTFHEVYCRMFIKFNELWKEENPPNVMSFGIIQAKFMERITKEAVDGILLD